MSEQDVLSSANIIPPIQSLKNSPFFITSNDSLILMEEHRLRVPKNRALRRKVGQKRD
jgi:hypothetical protein